MGLQEQISADGFLEPLLSSNPNYALLLSKYSIQLMHNQLRPNFDPPQNNEVTMASAFPYYPHTEVPHLLPLMHWSFLIQSPGLGCCGPWCLGSVTVSCVQQKLSDWCARKGDVFAIFKTFQTSSLMSQWECNDWAALLWMNVTCQVIICPL